MTTLDPRTELRLTLTGAARTLQCALPPSGRRATPAEQQVLLDAVVSLSQALQEELSWELPREAVRLGFGQVDGLVVDRLCLVAHQLDYSATHIPGSLDWIWAVDQVSWALAELAQLGGTHEAQVLGALCSVMADAMLESGIDLWVQRNAALHAAGRLSAREALDDLFALMC